MNPFLDSVIAVLVVAALLLLFTLWTRFAARRTGGVDGPAAPSAEVPRRQRLRRASRMTFRGGRRTS